MARRKGIWEKVDGMLDDGKSPTIPLSKAFEVKNPKRPVGRPRKYAPGVDQHKLDGYVLTSGKSRMTCRNPGCSNKLPKYTSSICCSVLCENELRDRCSTYLKALSGELDPMDLPVRYRSNRMYPLRGKRRSGKKSVDRRLAGVAEREGRLPLDVQRARRAAGLRGDTATLATEIDLISSRESDDHGDDV